LARKIKHLTWGEFKQTGSPLLDESGRRVGFIDFAEWVTLCGKSDDNPKEACAFDHAKPRPLGVCRACWKKFREAMFAPDSLRGFDGEPVQVLATEDSSGVIVSHLGPNPNGCRCHGQGECAWCISPF
jgi:hypothetical protein